MSKKPPLEIHYTKEAILQIIHTIRNQEWCELPPKWADKDGGGGEYIQQDHFHVQVNPQKISDLGSYELKTHRSKSTSLVTLGSLDPKGLEKASLLHTLLLQYGYSYKGGKISQYKCRKRQMEKVCKHVKYNYPDGLCYPPDELALGIDICGKDVTDSPQNNWGFYLDVDRINKTLFMHFDPNRTSKEEKYQYWLDVVKTRNDGLRDLDNKYSLNLDAVEKSAIEKFRNMLFIKYLEKQEGDAKYIKIDEAYFLSDFDFERFLTALERGEVMYELRLHGNKERISKNHGTGFRMFERNFPAVYSRKEHIA